MRGRRDLELHSLLLAADERAGAMADQLAESIHYAVAVAIVERLCAGESADSVASDYFGADAFVGGADEAIRELRASLARGASGSKESGGVTFHPCAQRSDESGRASEGKTPSDSNQPPVGNTGVGQESAGGTSEPSEPVRKWYCPDCGAGVEGGDSYVCCCGCALPEEQSEPVTATVELHCGRWALMVGGHGVVIETDPCRSDQMPNGGWGKDGLDALAEIINADLRQARMDYELLSDDYKQLALDNAVLRAALRGEDPE